MPVASSGVTVRVATVPFGALSSEPVVPVACDTPVVAERVVERAAVEVEVLGFGLAHRVEQLEAGDIGVAARGDERDLAVEQLLLGVEHVEHVAGADRLLGAGALERELVGGDGDLVRLDRLERRLVGWQRRSACWRRRAARYRDRCSSSWLLGTPGPGGRARRPRRPGRSAAGSDRPMPVLVPLLGGMLRAARTDRRRCRAH